MKNNKFSLVYILKVISLAIVIGGYCSISFAGVILEKTIKIRSGSISLFSDRSKSQFYLKFNGKVILTQKDLVDVDILGPFAIGEHEVIPYSTFFGGNCCGDLVDTSLLLFDVQGKMSKAKIVDLAGKLSDSFSCEWAENSDIGQNPVLNDEKLVFQCIERQGRRKKTSYVVYEKGVAKESRVSPFKK